jgi:N2227-like protein
LRTLAQAKNVVNYLRIIHRILTPGGVWINLGDTSGLSVPIYISSTMLQVHCFGTLKTTPQVIHPSNWI